MIRKPDYVCGGLQRWYLVPLNKYVNVYLHKFTLGDGQTRLHDHPWWSVSFLLKGRLKEVYGARNKEKKSRFIKQFIPYIRSPKFLHNLQPHEGFACTLFITFGL